jgi:hypothetical protein
MTVLLGKPCLITSTISDSVYRNLINASDDQGRSLSNLAAFLVERALEGVAVGRSSTERPEPSAVSARGREL